MTSLLEQVLHGFNVFTLGYFVVLQLTFTVLAIVGWRAIEDYVERRPMRDYRAVAESEMSMPVSILVPAYNEAPSIVASLRSLLTSQFVEFEVVVINDGSTDETMAALTDAFGLVKVGRVPRSNISTQLVHGVYTSPLEPRVVVIDKVNGGKADALNAGINHAVYPLFCAIDADTMLDADALSRLVWEFQAAPETVAVGGIVRIVNGSEFEDGRLARVRTPRNLLANLQIIEYLRAFLGGRIGWSKSGMLLIISGAFGLFRRDVCVEVGGYDPTTVGEDAELVLRLHRHQREHQRPCRITFFPDPICWTECPEDLGTLVARPDRDDRPPPQDAVAPALRADWLRRDALLHLLRAVGSDDRVLRVHPVRALAGPRDRLAPVRTGVLRRLADLQPRSQLPRDPDGGACLPPLPGLERPDSPNPVRGGRERRLPPAARGSANACLVHAGPPQAALG
jgi:cellulose synthase/poly-beta-1,6-N-acetylglucosamine synthase-like glycosyltransferase